MNYLDNLQGSLLNKSLDGLWARFQTISNNLANASTPGYKSQTVSFEDALAAAMRSGGDPVKAVKNSPITYGQTDGLTMRLDGNNVDAVAEQAELARAQLNYSMLIQLKMAEGTRMRSVISEGKK